MYRAHRALSLVIAAVLVGDAAALAVVDDDGPAGSRPAPAAPLPTSPSPVRFRHDFAGPTLFKAGAEESNAVTIDGTYRSRFLRQGDRQIDSYTYLPKEAPEHPAIQRAQDLSVEIEAQNASGEPDNWFGVFCRYQGFESDLYRAAVWPDGAWTLARTTISSHQYESEILLSGTTPAIVGVQAPDFVFRIRLDCIGAAPTVLRLSVNGTQLGAATLPSGLPPGDVGMVAASTAGEIHSDNLAVTEIT